MQAQAQARLAAAVVVVRRRVSAPPPSRDRAPGAPAASRRQRRAPRPPGPEPKPQPEQGPELEPEPRRGPGTGPAARPTPRRTSGAAAAVDDRAPGPRRLHCAARTGTPIHRITRRHTRLHDGVAAHMSAATPSVWTFPASGRARSRGLQRQHLGGCSWTTCEMRSCGHCCATLTARQPSAVDDRGPTRPLPPRTHVRPSAASTAGVEPRGVIRRPAGVAGGRAAWSAAAPPGVAGEADCRPRPCG